MQVHISLGVSTGIKSQKGAQVISLSGEREPIQTVIQFADDADFETDKSSLVSESRERSSLQVIYLLGQSAADADTMVMEIYRCERIAEAHRSDPDQEVRDYCISQTDRATKLKKDLQQKLERGLKRGAYVFRGQSTAVNALDSELTQATKLQLSAAATEIFDRYPDAAVRAETNVAERFLRLENLNAVTSQIDPLGLVEKDGGSFKVNTDHAAIIGIRNYIDRTGTIEGKRLQEHFGGAPFGWSPDTVRYVVAAMLMTGEVKVRISGNEVTAAGQQAIDALKTNNTFKNIGILLRDDRPSNEVVSKAAERLTDLTGENVVPLEQNISQTAAKHLPQVNQKIASLPQKLDDLAIPGGDKIAGAAQEIADLLLTDASDAPFVLGKEESNLYETVIWALAVKKSLDQGLESTISAVRKHQKEIEALPDKGTPGQLKSDVEDEMQQIDSRLAADDFYKHGADLSTLLTGLKSKVNNAASNLISEQQDRVRAAEKDLERLSEWDELTKEEQNNVLNQIDELHIEVETDLEGLRRLVCHEFDVQSSIAELKARVIEEGQERRRKRVEREKGKKDGDAKEHRVVNVPEVISDLEELEQIIKALEKVKAEMTYFDSFEIRIEKE